MLGLPPLLLPFLALGRCHRTLVLTTYQFFYLSLSLRFFAPTSAPLQFSERLLLLLLLLPDPFRGMGAWRKTMEPQKPGNSEETVRLQSEIRREWIREIRKERLQGIAEGASSAPRLASSSAVSFPGRNECPGTR